MVPIVLVLCWVLSAPLTWFSLPSLPSQNTSESEGGGDGHQSSINTLPDVSLVRHQTGDGGVNSDAEVCLHFCSSLLHQHPMDVIEAT